ncbi:hypothetical protein [Dokdonella immobilis]|uniref:hypothetical protein n=1 Tax=Dokdonella immobilis TaxID=578942 RepID=UPI00158755C8|nr:hypothetical protein [Dokdonella immobilis]
MIFVAMAGFGGGYVLERNQGRTTDFDAGRTRDRCLWRRQLELAFGTSAAPTTTTASAAARTDT